MRLKLCESVNNSQKVYDPAMMPFATGVGKSIYARRVKGIERAANNVGGMTSRNLVNIQLSVKHECARTSGTHLSIGR